jgi:hypothetical protein
MRRIFTRQQLHDLIRERAVLKVAPELGISDVELRKRCIAHAIPLPDAVYTGCSARVRFDVGADRDWPVRPPRRRDDPGGGSPPIGSVCSSFGFQLSQYPGHSTYRAHGYRFSGKKGGQPARIAAHAEIVITSYSPVTGSARDVAAPSPARKRRLQHVTTPHRAAPLFQCLGCHFAPARIVKYRKIRDLKGPLPAS